MKIIKTHKINQNGLVPAYDIMLVEQGGEYIVKDSDGDILSNGMYKIEMGVEEFDKIVEDCT